PGPHTLSAQLIGFETQYKTEVRVTSDFTTNISFILKEAPLQMGEIVVEAQSGQTSWGMLATKANMPAVEPDKTTSMYVIRGEDIESLSIVRTLEEFIELQAGVTVDENGEEITLRAGDPEDIAYYFDGIPLPTTDHVETRVYRNFNRLSIQELTVVAGGMNAEYGNALGGVVNVVSRDGNYQYRGLIDYRFTPAGKKHWGQNVYDSPTHRDNTQWNDPAWVAETVTLPDGSSVQAHNRADYTGVSGQYIEGNTSGPLKNNTSFFASSRWQRVPVALPGPNLHSPFNLNTSLKLTHTLSQNIKLRVGGLYDFRQGALEGPGDAGQRDVRKNGRNLFLNNPAPVGGYDDKDRLLYVNLTHMLSNKTFYEIKLSHSSSQRDTSGVPIPSNMDHVSEAVSQFPITDQSGFYNIYSDAFLLERFSRNRLTLKADLSSQVDKRHFLKAGLEFTRFNNWYQRYQSEDPTTRMVGWYGRTLEDTDFLPGQENKGVTPYQFALYAQDKIELDGMIVNIGVRADLFFQNTSIIDALNFGNAPMYETLTRARQMPTTRGPTIRTISPRLGISHPVTERSLVRFFYGKFAQPPNFLGLYYNSWTSQQATDNDLNGNGVIDSGERWNSFSGFKRSSEGNRPPEGHNNPNLPPEETESFEVGFDWNFAGDYVLGLTSYYKRSQNGVQEGTISWSDPGARGLGFSLPTFYAAQFRDARGLEFNLKKRFSNLFAFHAGINVQWATQGSLANLPRGVFADSLFVAHGHYWNTFDIDPTTGAEIPVTLQEKARRDYNTIQNAQTRLSQELGRDPESKEIVDATNIGLNIVKHFLEGEDPNYYVNEYAANATINMGLAGSNGATANSWASERGHHAEEGVFVADGRNDILFYDSFYDDDDRAYWEHVNNTPGYPGTGEANLTMRYSLRESQRNTDLPKDRRFFGNMTFLFATPKEFGPLKGKAVGNLRANLVYRIFTGTPFESNRVGNSQASVQLTDSTELNRDIKSGPMHTRVDLNVEKGFNFHTTRSLTLAVEVFNLFNQRDVRSRHPEDAINFRESDYQRWGIEGAVPTDADLLTYGETFDINNYWDSPREITFSLSLQW
ncbi:MAG: TonB-dependent receptor, partial [Candidatus Latescibacteria bacterium]|nr:TonB-dependent receptor [Candidatus Latescibacterota bacterium]